MVQDHPVPDRMLPGDIAEEVGYMYRGASLIRNTQPPRITIGP